VASDKKQLQHLHDNEKLHNHLATNGIIWHFVPSAPNFGVVWVEKRCPDFNRTFHGFMTDQRIIELENDLLKLTDIEDIDVLAPDYCLPVDRLVAIRKPTTEDFPMNRRVVGNCSPDFGSISGGANKTMERRHT
jgi:hypothetical protein